MKIIKYFLEFISILSLFSIFKLLGLKNASNLGALLGIYIGPLFRSESVIKKNIKIGIRNIGDEEIKSIIDGMWSNIGRTLAEYIFLSKFRKDRNSN